MVVVHDIERSAPADGESSPTRPLAVSICLLTAAVAGAGLTVATGVAVLSYLVTGADGASSDAVRTGALVWMGLHGGSLSVSSATVSLVPLLVPLLIGLLLWRGCRWAVATSAATSRLLPAGLSTTAAALAGATCYAVIVALVGWGVEISSAPGAVDIAVLRAAGLSFVAAAATVGVGLFVATGSWAELAERRPPVGAVVRGAAAGVQAMLALSALTLVVATAWRAGQVLTIGADLEPGIAGAVGVVLLSVCTLPNAVLWTAAYLVGPGFAVGAGTVVSPDGVLLGALPAYPLFGTLPAPGPPGGWLPLLTVAPVLAGALAGVVAVRELGTSGWWWQALHGGAAGVCAGLSLALLLFASGGSIGPGRMEQTGPLPAALLVGVLTVAVAASAGAVAYGALCGWRPSWLHRPRWTRRPGWFRRTA
ncbi:hypothetical protein BH24ACT11_BH24ACT11_04710 [soil metagenome]